MSTALRRYPVLVALCVALAAIALIVVFALSLSWMWIIVGMLVMTGQGPFGGGAARGHRALHVAHGQPPSPRPYPQGPQ